MIIIVDSTETIVSPKTAKKFIRDHVIIKRSALRKIRALARKRGFLAELKMLGIEVYPLRDGDT